MARTKDAPFNNPFADARTRKALARVVVSSEKPAVQRAKKRVLSSTEALTPEEEARLWEEATRGGTPIHVERGLSLVRSGRGSLQTPADPDDEAFQRLVAFVRGQGSFDLADQDEFVEGFPGTRDPQVMERLRRGEWSVQAWLDLHGLIVDEAKEELAAFFKRARLSGMRCVLVVHGRGLHSKDRVPVLKERIVAWMNHGRFSREVVGFCTARQHDGGAGALYVLLRSHDELRHARRRRHRGRRGAGTRSGASQ